MAKDKLAGIDSKSIDNSETAGGDKADLDHKKKKKFKCSTKPWGQRKMKT